MRLPALPALSISHQLALLIAACVVLAVLAVGGVSLWNLRTGFGDYLRLRDDEQLTRVMEALERRAASDPDLNWLRADRAALRDLHDEALGLPPNVQRRPTRPRHPPPRPGHHPPPGHEAGAQDEPPPWATGPAPPEGGPPGEAPPAQPGDSLRGRLVILDASGVVVAGRALPPAQARSRRAIKVQGSVVGSVELAAEAQPEGIDARFLQRQTLGLAGAAGAATVLALLLGYGFARRWSRPLQQLQQATRRIAGGELKVTVGSPQAPLRSSAKEIDLLIGDVNTMAASLAALEQTRRTWIAQISHELRTPLAVLRGELEAIEDGARQPTPDVLKGLRDEVLQLARLVDDLHLLSVSDMGQLPCEFVAADADAALFAWGEKFSQRACNLGLTLHVQPRTDALAVRWDMGRMEQLVTNLLENSLRYTDAPGRIALRWKASAHTVSITVEDSAPGVPPELHRQLFDPLFRVDKARTRTGQHGSGLGLSIVRAIARAHRGTAEARASSLGGLCMDLELPRDPSVWDRRSAK